MACNRSCMECANKVVASAATLVDGVLVLTLPADVRYANDCKYCFVLGTALPDGVPINTPVAVAIGTGTVQFPVLTRCGTQMVVQQLRTRCRYPFRVATTATAGSIVLLKCLDDPGVPVLAALNDATAPAGGDGG